MLCAATSGVPAFAAMSPGSAALPASGPDCASRCPASETTPSSRGPPGPPELDPLAPPAPLEELGPLEPLDDAMPPEDPEDVLEVPPPDDPDAPLDALPPEDPDDPLSLAESLDALSESAVRVGPLEEPSPAEPSSVWVAEEPEHPVVIATETTTGTQVVRRVRRVASDSVSFWFFIVPVGEVPA